MVTLSVKSGSGEMETIKRFVLDGLEEEKRKLEYALDLTMEKIKGFEKRFGMSTDEFLEKFRSFGVCHDERSDPLTSSVK